MGTSFKKVRLIFSQSLIQYQHTFSTFAWKASSTLGFVSSAQRVPWSVVYWDCRDDGEGQSTPLLKLPPLCADPCAGWRCHAGGRPDSSSCLAEPFEFLLLIPLMSAHIALNCGTFDQDFHLTRSLHYPRNRCCGWSIFAGQVTSVLFSALKRTGPVSNCANICGTLTIHASEKYMSLCRTVAFCSKKFSHHSVPSTHHHNIRHFALLLC